MLASAATGIAASASFENSLRVTISGSVPYSAPARWRAAPLWARLRNHIRAAPGRLPFQLLCPLVILEQFLGDLVGYVGAGAAEFAAQAFLGSRPDHVAVFVHQPDSGYGLVFALHAV